MAIASMQKSIRTRLILTFMVIIVLTVSILEALLIYAVKQSYYGSLESSLTNQIRISADLYEKYFSDSTLQENVLYNVDAFWKQSNAQVQIVDKNGSIIMDSMGEIDQSESYPDISQALSGNTGTWIGMNHGERIMAVTQPLMADGEIVGALRFITSLREVDQDIQRMTYLFVTIGMIVIALAALMSIFFANTIIIPLQEVTKTALKMAQGNFTVRSQKHRDDEIGKLSDTLNYMAEEIVKREQLKNEFISSVSHELRTPLTSIMGWAITLQNQAFQTKEMLDDGLGIIAKESKRLTFMVEELLDFSRFISNQVQLQISEIDLRALLDQLYKQLLPRAMRENIEFSLDCPDELPTIFSDENRLKQVFINILDNAFNFTAPGGQVSLRVQYSGDQFRFVISDTGCGIPPEELPHVKEKFFKGKSSHSKNGIGLSICEEIVRLMDGRLEIASEVNVGTQVTIQIPRGVAEDGAK